MKRWESGVWRRGVFLLPGRPWWREGRLEHGCASLCFSGWCSTCGRRVSSLWLPLTHRWNQSLWLQRRTRWSGPTSWSSSPAAWGGSFPSPRSDQMGVGHPLRRFKAELASSCRAAPSGRVPRRWCGGRCSVTLLVAWWRPEGPDHVSHLDLGSFSHFY
jgi:hypothetical protein